MCASLYDVSRLVPRCPLVPKATCWSTLSGSGSSVKYAVTRCATSTRSEGWARVPARGSAMSSSCRTAGDSSRGPDRPPALAAHVRPSPVHRLEPLTAQVGGAWRLAKRKRGENRAVRRVGAHLFRVFRQGGTTTRRQRRQR